MSLRDLLTHELSSTPSFDAGSQEFSVHEGSQSLHIELVELDTLACTFNRFALATSSLSHATVDQLTAISDRLSKKLGYLLETIGAVETDAEHCVVQMRSVPPHKDDDGTSYYELLVRRGGELSLCRYQKTPGNTRQVIPAHVTREVLLRLAADFSAAASK